MLILLFTNSKKIITKMHKFILSFIILIIPFFGFSQANESQSKRISVNYKNTKIETVLADLEAKAGVRFSYNPVIFKNFEPITYLANNQSLNEILLEILDGGISYKTRGNYIILQKKKEEEKEFLVMGFISNELTNERIFNASIYEPTTLASTLSNRYGYYQIRLRSNLNYIDLKVQKRDFQSETVKVPFRKNGKLNIEMTEKIKPKPTEISPIKINPLEKIQIKPDTIKQFKLDSISKIIPPENEPIESSKPEQKAKPLENLGPTVKAKSEKFMDWLMSTTQKIHFNNIEDSISRPFQLSFLPFIGTNGRLSSTISNDYSINVISGVSKSINKFEIGGFLNLVRENMTGVQLAGFGNIVGKNQTGLQLAGFTNINFRSSIGVLGSGFANLTFGPSYGLQMAGFSNLNFNTLEGVQMAGFSNINLKKMKGVQIAGFINITKDTLIGSQIGTFNIASKMKNGVQIGFFNYIDQAEKVLPIGFFSFVRKGGYRRFELNTNELGLAEISFKTGVRAFYNIFSAQYNTRNNSLPSYSFGYGIGSSANITRKLSIDFNILASQFVTKDWNPEGWTNQMLNTNINLELKLGKRLAIFGGPTYNWYTTPDNSFDINTLKLANLKTRNTNWSGTNQNLYSWLGFKAGIRLFNIN
jgi:hypothetical protein